MDLSFWLAVAALMLATWAVVRCEQIKSRALSQMKNNWSMTWRAVDQAALLTTKVKFYNNQIAELRRACGERSTACRTRLHELESAWPPPVLRTTSGERPEVRAVEEKSE